MPEVLFQISIDGLSSKFKLLGFFSSHQKTLVQYLDICKYSQFQWDCICFPAHDM